MIAFNYTPSKYIIHTLYYSILWSKHLVDRLEMYVCTIICGKYIRLQM